MNLNAIMSAVCTKLGVGSLKDLQLEGEYGNESQVVWSKIDELQKVKRLETRGCMHP